MENLRFIRHSSWDEVFETWRKQEGNLEHWKIFAKEKKGFDSWEEWRRYCASLFKAEEREWDLYEVQDPQTTIANFLIGPFQSWQIHFDKDKLTHSFAYLAEHHTDWMRDRVADRKFEVFPEDIQLICVEIEGKGIYVFEGHHRCAAIAYGNHIGKPVTFTRPPTIAYTKLPAEDFHMFEHMLVVGSFHPHFQHA